MTDEPGAKVAPPAAPGSPAVSGSPAAPESGADPARSASTPAPKPAAGLPVHRPILERLGMASIALVLAVLFGAMAAASWVGHEPFLAIMAGIGALMTAWAGVITITRG